MKTLLAVLTFVHGFSQAQANTSCTAGTNITLPEISSCQDGDGFIVSEKDPSAPRLRCPGPQIRSLKTCFRGQVHAISTGEFISFASSKKNNVDFLKMLQELKLISKPSTAELEKYLDSLRVSESQVPAEPQSLVIHDDGDEKEFTSLEKLRQLFTDWRKENSVSPKQALTLENIEKIQRENEILLKELNGYSCESPKAKEILKKIKVPVIRFTDNVEQFVFPLQQNTVVKGRTFQVIHLSGFPNKGGLFQMTPDSLKTQYASREVYQTDNGISWVSNNSMFEVGAVRYMNMEEAGASVYQKISTCDIQSQLKALTGLPNSASPASKASSGSARPTQ